MALYNIRKVRRLYDRDTIRELEYRASRLQESNARLKEEYVNNEKDTMGFVQSFQQKIEDHNRKVLKLRADMRRFGGKDLNRKLEYVRQDHEKALHAAQKKFEEMEADMNRQVQSVDDELTVLRTFVHNRHKCEEELRKLREESQKLDSDHREELDTLEKRFDTEKQAIEKNYEMKKKSIEEKSYEEASRTLNRRIKSIVQTNNTLKEELGLQDDFHEKLAEEIQQLKAQIERVSNEQEQIRDIELKKIGESHRLAKTLKGLREKRRVAFANVNAYEARCEDSLASKTATFETKKAAIETSITHKRHLCEVHIKEICSLRSSAETAIQNMSPVERDFRKALELHRPDKKSGVPTTVVPRKAAKKQGKQLTFPSIRMESGDGALRAKKPAVESAHSGAGDDEEEFKWFRVEAVVNTFLRISRETTKRGASEPPAGSETEVAETLSPSFFLTTN